MSPNPLQLTILLSAGSREEHVDSPLVVRVSLPLLPAVVLGGHGAGVGDQAGVHRVGDVHQAHAQQAGHQQTRLR